MGISRVATDVSCAVFWDIPEKKIRAGVMPEMIPMTMPKERATGDGERSHALAFSGSFQGMRPSTEAIMQESLTPA